MTTLSNSSTIQQGKDFLRENFESGVECPCCGQFVKRYKRSLNSGMAVFLIGLYRLSKKHPNELYFSAKKVMKEMNLQGTSLDYAVLRHFGFTKENDEKREGKRKSGYWMITSSGESFVRKQITTHKYVYLYNNRFDGHDGEKISIKDALMNRFRYEDLMSGF